MRNASIALLLLIALTASTHVQGYTTSGNRIYDASGKAVLLRGICRPSTEWNEKGQYIGQSDWNLMKGWGANVIRITMNQCYWNQNLNGYQAFIDVQVTYILSLGLGVILDLHWSDKGTGSGCGQQTMPDNNSVTFWKSVATKYKNNPWIIFELYNEPHDISWSVWRNGGDAGGYYSPGHQALYNAVRVDAGANNAVIINGINWAFDLSGVSANPITGTNIIYGTHPYDFGGKQPSDWSYAFGTLAKTYPVIATEFGGFDCTTKYYESFTTYANQNDISWTAWGWWVQGCDFPSVISDWSGTPTAPGAVIKAQLTSGPKVPSGGGSVSTTTPAPTTAAPTTTTTRSGATTTTTRSGATTTTTRSGATTTQAPVTTTKSPSTTVSSGPKITVNVNGGTNQYWLHVDSFTSATKTVTSLEFKDSLSGAGWVAGYTETWGPGWTWSPNRVISTPVNLRLTASDGSVVELTGVITSIAAGGTYVSTANF